MVIIMKKNHVEFKKINPFDMDITYIELDSVSPLNVYNPHIHEECEIYINISGNVSFEVENRLYPLTPGSVIITRPYEYHHCIYHNNDLHKHFWILFSARGNEELFKLFFDRKSGTGNLLQPDADKSRELLATCERLAEADSETEKYYLFFKIINILCDCETVDTAADISNICVTKALGYLNNNPRLTVSELAKKCSVSVNTLERNFKSCFGLTPSTYIKKKRLINAAKLLSRGYSVTEAAEASGFGDCSNFISVFRKFYHMTPLKYKKLQE